MIKEEIVVFKGEDKKIYWGRVIFHQDWFERWKNEESVSIVDIVFDDDMPPNLNDYEVEDIIKKVSKEFVSKTGLSWEAFCTLGQPSYKEIMKLNVQKSDNEELRKVIKEIEKECKRLKKDGEKKNVKNEKILNQIMREYEKVERVKQRECE